MQGEENGGDVNIKQSIILIGLQLFFGSFVFVIIAGLQYGVWLSVTIAILSAFLSVASWAKIRGETKWKSHARVFGVAVILGSLGVILADRLCQMIADIAIRALTGQK